MTLIKSIYGFVKAEYLWFKEYIKTKNLKVGLKQCKINPCLIYRVNELRTTIVVVYIDDKLVIGEKPKLMDTIECTKKEYAT